MIGQGRTHLTQGDGMESAGEAAGDAGDTHQHIRQAHVGQPGRFQRPAREQDTSQGQGHHKVEQASALHYSSLSSGWRHAHRQPDNRFAHTYHQSHPVRNPHAAYMLESW